MSKNDGQRRRLLPIIWGGLRLLKPRERRLAVVLNVAVAIVEALQMAALLTVLPVVGLVVQPELARNSEPVAKLHGWLGAPPTDRFILLLAGLVLLLTVLAHLASFFVQYAIEAFAARAQTRLARDLIAECIAAPYPWFLDRNSAALVRLFHNDILLWGRDFVGSFLRLLAHVLTIIAGATVVLVAAPLGGLAVLSIVALLAYAILWLMRPHLVRWSALKRQASEDTMIMENQIFSGVKDIKVTGKQSFFVQLFAGCYGSMSGTAVRMVVLGMVPAAVMLLIGQVSLLLITVALWQSGSRGGAIAAQMALLVLVTSRVVPAINRLSASVNALANAIPWVGGILDMRSSIVEARNRQLRIGGGVPIKPEWGRIRLDGVSFTYHGSDRLVLSDVSAELAQGRSYGLIGSSGAGKSTLVDLLLGLLQPTAGRILIDDVPLDQVDLRQWRRHVGYVPQSPYFTDDSILANIAFGIPSDAVDEANVRACIEMAGLESFIANLPRGVETRLGDRAVKISGGERQRIAIARALYNQPRLLILDEATGALDAATEQLVCQALERWKGRTTTLIISHRMSAVAGCDRVFLLDQGRMIASGSFEEVMVYNR